MMSEREWIDIIERNYELGVNGPNPNYEKVYEKKNPGPLV